MTDERSPSAALAELSRAARGDELARLLRTVAEHVAVARSRGVAAIAKPLLDEAGLAAGQIVTGFGDPVAALERGANDRAERLLVGALLAKGVALAPPAGVDAEDRCAGELLWMAAHTDVDAFPAIDAALGEKAAGLWGALCDLVRRIDAGREPSFDRADALVGAASLRITARDDVRAAVARLADEVSDPALRALLEGGAAPKGPPLPPIEGEMQPTPRGPIATALLAVTGILLVLRGGRLLGRLALARKRPAKIEITADGVRISSRTEMLGRVLGEAEHVFPATSLVRATREIRFPRLALYAGLLALAIGSYVGVALFVDGVRAASPSLLGQGLVVVALGIALELGMTTLFPGARGKCRVVFVPKKGAAVCVGELEIDGAQAMLATLSRARTLGVLGATVIGAPTTLLGAISPRPARLAASRSVAPGARSLRLHRGARPAAVRHYVR